MNMKAIVSAALLVLVSMVPALSAARTSPQSTKPQEKVQHVRLTFDAKGYVVTPATLKKGVPVKMDVDLDTVTGCMRTVVIDAFAVKKTVKAGDTTIEFTPTKSGKVEIVCGMNMGKGSFTVEEPGPQK
jgi:plastocyanin domain-containing protein